MVNDIFVLKICSCFESIQLDKPSKDFELFFLATDKSTAYSLSKGENRIVQEGMFKLRVHTCSSGARTKI
jgi:hypothetical protein